MYTTLFIEVTTLPGQAMNAFQPFGRSRFKICTAANESSSLNPSKVATTTSKGVLR